MYYRWDFGKEFIDNQLYSTKHSEKPKISFYPIGKFWLTKSAYTKMGLTYQCKIAIIKTHGQLYITRAIDDDKNSFKLYTSSKRIAGNYKIEVNFLYDKSFIITEESIWRGRRLFKLEPSEIRDYKRNQ